jgi:hypothetical protein
MAKASWLIVIFGEQGMSLLPTTLGLGWNWTRWRLLRPLRPLYPAPVAWRLGQFAPRVTKSDDEPDCYVLDKGHNRGGTGRGDGGGPGEESATERCSPSELAPQEGLRALAECSLRTQGVGQAAGTRDAKQRDLACSFHFDLQLDGHDHCRA